MEWLWHLFGFPTKHWYSWNPPNFFHQLLHFTQRRGRSLHHINQSFCRNWKQPCKWSWSLLENNRYHFWWPCIGFYSRLRNHQQWKTRDSTCFKRGFRYRWAIRGFGLFRLLTNTADWFQQVFISRRSRSVSSTNSNTCSYADNIPHCCLLQHIWRHDQWRWQANNHGQSIWRYLCCSDHFDKYQRWVRYIR